VVSAWITLDGAVWSGFGTLAAGTGIWLSGRVRASGFGICLLLGAAALLPAAGAASAEPAGAKSKQGKRVIVRPKSGKRVRRYPVRAVVKGRDGLFDLKATLNGKGIAGAFGRTRKGKRTARLSRSHGLRHGRNVLRVKARRKIGQRRRRAKVAFFVGRKRPLAGAGRDRRIVEGERFRFRGQALPHPRKPRARGKRRVKYRWRITKAPRQSSFRDNAASGSPRVAGKPLSKPTARRPGFTPDVRGRYRFKLRVTDGKRSSSDEVRLNAVPGTPFVPIETMDTSGHFPAIQVGGKPYSAQAVEDPWLQVLVLDRATLGFVSNKTYRCPYPHNCAQTVAHDLSKLDDTKLVIAVNQPNFVRPYGLSDALAPIGFPKYDLYRFDDAPSGTVSAIGVPGLPAGQADISIDLDGPPGIANMDGYLTPDQFFNYTWLPKERPLYDTRESSTIELGKGNVMEIDGKKIESEAIFNDSGEFQVLVLDGLTLDVVDNKTYFTNTDGGRGSSSTTNVDRMRRRLAQVTPGQIVFVTSIVQDPMSQPVDPNAAPAAWNQLANQIASLGGSRHTFFEASAKQGASYTLVGWGGAGEANGEESSSVKDPQPGGGRLQGALMPDHTSQLRPAVTSVGDAPNETLMQLALKPEGPWPLDGNTQAQAAIKWIGSQIKQLGSNPRSAYWIQDFKQSGWMGIADQVSKLTYPGRLIPHGFSKQNFQLAQSELVKEINWVGDVRGYLSDLSTPFSDSALQSWAKLTTISDKVENALKPPADKTQASVFDVVRGIYGLIGVAGGPPAEAVAEVFQVATDIIAENRDGSDASDINVRASELAANLIDRLKNAQAATQRLGDIIVADYTKLSTVGTNERCAPGPGCPVEWQFTAEDKQSAAASVYKGIETLFDKQLMGLAFPAYSLKTSTRHHNAREWTCGRTGDFRFEFQPFDDTKTNQVLPDNGQSELTIAKPGTYQVYALGSVFPDEEPYTMTVPPGATLDRMFSPASSSLDPTQGGLGIYPPDFMLHANPRDYPSDALCGFPGDG
jgi:hypothetical protein